MGGLCLSQEFQSFDANTKTVLSIRTKYRNSNFDEIRTMPGVNAITHKYSRHRVSPVSLHRVSADLLSCSPTLTDWDHDGDLDLSCSVVSPGPGIMYYENAEINSAVIAAKDDAPGCSITPNSCSDFFTLSYDSDKYSGARVEVLNTSGELIYAGLLLKGQETMRCDDWPAGMYVVRIQQDNNTTTQAFLVAH